MKKIKRKAEMLLLSFLLTMTMSVPAFAQTASVPIDFTIVHAPLSFEISEEIKAVNSESESSAFTGCEIGYDDLIVRNTGYVDFNVTDIAVTVNGDYKLVPDQEKSVFQSMPAGSNQFSMAISNGTTNYDLYNGSFQITDKLSHGNTKNYSLSGKKSPSVAAYDGTLGAIVVSVSADENKADTSSCITFSAADDFTVSWVEGTNDPGAGHVKWDGTLYYSQDAKTWKEWDGTEVSSQSGKLYFRGKNNTYLSGGNTHFAVSGTGLSVLGNIETLLDYTTVESGKHPAMGDDTYFGLFAETPLVDASNLTLPATELSNCCYKQMFVGCESLVAVPTLPAMTLSLGCYDGMFMGTAITEMPELPATKLADDCYANMFMICYNLQSVSALPVTELANGCYNQMFFEATGLEEIPALPATTIPSNAYAYMFASCSQIIVSETKTAECPYEYRIPTSGTGTAKKYAFEGMFCDTGGTFTDDPEINKTYYVNLKVIS